MAMHALLLGTLLALGTPPPAPATPRLPSVLFLPISVPEGTPKETTDVLNQLLATEAQRLGTHKVNSWQEIEGTMTQEQARQIAGCTSENCAAEIAGALATDQIVITTVARVGERYIVTMALVSSRDASVLRRTAGQYPGSTLEPVVDGVPALVRELFGVPARAAPRAVSQDEDHGPSPVKLAAAGGLVVVGALLVPAALGLAGAAVTTQVVPRVVATPSLGAPFLVKSVAIYSATVLLAAGGVLAVVASLASGLGGVGVGALAVLAP